MNNIRIPSSNDDREQNLKLNLICPYPNCGTNKTIDIDKENLNRESGLTKIMIDGLICEHKFVIYVDRNGSIRGCEKSDFTLSFDNIVELN